VPLRARSCRPRVVTATEISGADEYAVEADRDESGTEWEELADRVGGSPFLQPGWIRAWSRAFGSGRLELHVVRRGGRVAAVLPLERARLGRSSPTNFETPEFGILAIDRDASRTLAANVFNGEGFRLSLGFLDRGGGELEDLRAAARAAGRRVVERTLQRSPYMEIRADLEAQVRERLGSKFFNELRRRRRRLAERGPLELEVADGTMGLERLLAEGYALEGSGWKTAAGSSIDVRADATQFYDEVARWAARRGILRLCFLRTGGKPIAFKLGMEANGAFYSCKGGYDASESKFGPGQLIVWELLAWAAGRGLERFEFLGDAYPWKLEWTDTARERVLFEAFGSSPAAAAMWLVERHGRPLAKRLRLKRLVARARGM
jgi:CelD/BcsL family acetyltransferase involved in cellulose biosynthesis